MLILIKKKYIISYKISYIVYHRVSHSLFSEGGNGPPPIRWGAQVGGFGQVGGEMARDSITTIGLDSIVYFMEDRH